MATEYKAVGKLYQIWSFKMVYHGLYPLLDSSGLYRTNTWRVVKILTDDAPKTMYLPCICHGFSMGFPTRMRPSLKSPSMTVASKTRPVHGRHGLSATGRWEHGPHGPGTPFNHTQALGPLRLLLTKNSIKVIISHHVITFSNTRYSRNCMHLCLARIKRVCPKKKSQKNSHAFTQASLFSIWWVWGGVGWGS